MRGGRRPGAGAPKGNKNAAGNGAPRGNMNALKHGRRSEIMKEAGLAPDPKRCPRCGLTGPHSQEECDTQESALDVLVRRAFGLPDEARPA